MVCSDAALYTSRHVLHRGVPCTHMTQQHVHRMFNTVCLGQLHGVLSCSCAVSQDLYAMPLLFGSSTYEEQR